MTLLDVGAACFGLVVGWISYRTLRRKEGVAALSDIASVVGAVGGAGITALYKSDRMFASYSIGLASGFFGYFVVSLIIYGKVDTGRWMGN